MKLSSLVRIVEIDYYAYSAVVLPAGFWLVMALMTAIKAKNLDTALYLGIGLTVIGVGVLIWRIMQTTRLLTSGLEVPGTVQRTWFFRDRARITCTYTLKGQKYQSSFPVRLTRKVMGFKAGERVRLMVDRKNPNRFLIRQLFD